jgi:hypothetical protein
VSSFNLDWFFEGRLVQVDPILLRLVLVDPILVETGAGDGSIDGPRRLVIFEDLIVNLDGHWG